MLIRGRPIIVLGMHRSGTSAFTGMLHLLGIKLGSNLLPATPANEQGHWEHADIVTVHNQLLRDLGSRWDDVSPLPTNWWESDAALRSRAQLREILLRDFSHGDVWGLKDPRLCVLLPLWRPLLAELCPEPLYVVVARPPAEVIRSLQKRDGFPLQKSELLWLSYTLAAERHSRGKSRLIFTFNQLLEDGESVARNVLQAIPRPWPANLESTSIREFLNPENRHHRSESGGQGLTSWTVDAYQALVRGAEGDEAGMIRQFEPIDTSFEAAHALFGPEVAAARDLRQALGKSERNTFRKSQELQTLKKKFGRLERSWYVRMARFFRRARTEE